MLSATVSQGKDVYFWKTMPRSRPGPPTGLPSTRISPVSGWSRPAIMRSSVDFPQPDGPSRTLNSPRFRPSGEKASSTSKLTLCSASMRLPLGPAKLRERLRTEILVLFTLLPPPLLYLVSSAWWRTLHRVEANFRSRLPLGPAKLRERLRTEILVLFTLLPPPLLYLVSSAWWRTLQRVAANFSSPCST